MAAEWGGLYFMFLALLLSEVSGSATADVFFGSGENYGTSIILPGAKTPGSWSIPWPILKKNEGLNEMFLSVQVSSLNFLVPLNSV